MFRYGLNFPSDDVASRVSSSHLLKYASDDEGLEMEAESIELRSIN